MTNASEKFEFDVRILSWDVKSQVNLGCTCVKTFPIQYSFITNKKLIKYEII